MKLTDDIKERFKRFWAANGGNWGALTPIFDLLGGEREHGQLGDAFKTYFTNMELAIAEGGKEGRPPMVVEADDLMTILDVMDMKTRMLVASTCAQEPQRRLSLGDLRPDERIDACLRVKVPMSGNEFIDHIINVGRELDIAQSVETAKRAMRAQIEIGEQAMAAGMDDPTRRPPMAIARPDGMGGFGA